MDDDGGNVRDPRPEALSQRPRAWRYWVAYAVHLFTASGVVAGFMAIDAIIREEWRAAFVWMGVALFIDSVDGTMARRARVKEVLPKLDGALLDNLIDYFNYVIIPAFFFYMAGILPDGWSLVGVGTICISSAYQFCRTDAKTEDHYFRGFPSYWNVIVFYAVLLGLPAWLNLGIIFFCGVMVFVPIKYIYPSRAPRHRALNVALPALWIVAASVIVIELPDPPPAVLYGSLAFPAYYFGMSIYYTLSDRRRGAG
jgi:phosphatidylcholine synthase